MTVPGILRLGDEVPNFEALSTMGKINFHRYIDGEWCLFFSHPEDFTPVCTTELGQLSISKSEFDKRGVKLLGLSVDPVHRHMEWVKDIEEVYNTKLEFPIVDDSGRAISKSYGMLDQEIHDATNIDSQGLPFTVRSVFVVDPRKRIRLILTYPASCGRNFTEILRCIDSLQLSDSKPVTTPANWSLGDRVIVHPSVDTQRAEKIFASVEEVKPYLRFAKL